MEDQDKKKKVVFTYKENDEEIFEERASEKVKSKIYQNKDYRSYIENIKNNPHYHNHHLNCILLSCLLFMHPNIKLLKHLFDSSFSIIIIIVLNLISMQLNTNFLQRTIY